MIDVMQHGHSWHGGGPGYELSREPSAWVMRHLPFLAETNPRIAIDVGCFEGRNFGLLRHIIGPAGKLIGTDIDSKRFAGIPKEFNATLVETPLDRSLSVSTGCEGLGDAVLVHRVLHHLHDRDVLQDALTGLAALMRPGGRLLISARAHSGQGIIRQSTRNPDGTSRVDAYFGEAAFRDLFRFFFDVAFLKRFREGETYPCGNERVPVVNHYLGAGLVRRGL